MFHIEITLPRERTRPGNLTLWRYTGGDIRTLIGRWDCLGKADNARAAKKGNPSRDPKHIKGDTPTGVYCSRALTERPHAKDGDGIGRWWIPLEPAGGEALAAKWNGRTALGIHGGRPRRDGRLVPTEGCVRVDDTTIAELGNLLRGQAASITIMEG